jgi:hypothetical protein
MPYLDAIRLFFESVATVEDEDSIFGKDWGMTLQYVLHTPGLNFACTSRFNAQRDLWVFLGELTFCDVFAGFAEFPPR